MEADFSGYATKSGLKCSDGRTILPDAFSHQDKQKVPLVWQHGHDTPEAVLGHAILEARPDGVYAYGFFNDTAPAQSAKLLVQHGDVDMMSIFANKLVEKSKQVAHGFIREVSLVLSGANPGAKIDNVRLAHSDDPDDYEILEDEAVIHTGIPLSLKEETPEEIKHEEQSSETQEKTVEEIYETLTDDQKKVVEYIVGKAVEDDDETDDSAQHDDTNNEDALNHQEGDTMKRNAFDKAGNETEAEAELKHGETIEVGGTLSHDQMKTILATGKQLGSYKDALLAHADEYGITNIEVLFPDAKKIDATPQWITRRMEWVETVLNGTRKLPFSKIKSQSADLTHEEARAKGYIKADVKKEQFFEIKGRETGPKTIYKKQKLDRDDIIDLTEFDVVAWLWVEMRFMLREEVARAILIGDGREVDDPDKIDETKIRPIAMDDEFYTDVVTLDTNVQGEALVEAVLRNRETYEGTGQPSAFMQRAIVTDLLLLKDKMGRRLYRTRADLAAELEVSEIVDVPVMKGAKRDGGDIIMLLVNLGDYAVGATKGGEITTFEDFDIDVNQYKYLIEGRMSGALTKHKTAQVFVRAGGTEVTPTVPTFVSSTGVVTIPTKAGVVYKNADTDAVLSAGAQTAIPAGTTIEVEAVPAAGYYFPHNLDADWEFTRPTA